MTGDSGVALVESVNCILYSSTCLLAGDCSSEVDSGCAISDVRFFVAAHLKDNWLSFSVDKSSDCITERMILFEARISLILTPLRHGS